MTDVLLILIKACGIAVLVPIFVTITCVGILFVLYLVSAVCKKILELFFGKRVKKQVLVYEFNDKSLEGLKFKPYIDNDNGIRIRYVKGGDSGNE